ncbi:hypothetical protein LUZ60_005954 [Juncus effusus]|nr:hypothetical protein LUZ60_005954 [Juncus effusus]
MATTSHSSLIPSMHDILSASTSQRLKIHLSMVGPFFCAKAYLSDNSAVELGRAEGVIRPWIGGKVLHVDSMRMTRATVEMEKSIFGLGLFLGAVVIRHGFDEGCVRAELLAINDTPVYHNKLVRFYKRMGFRVVHEVDGSSMNDLAHMLVWGGRGTRMDADIEELLVKWSRKFKTIS